MPQKINKENEEFFLQLVADGLLSVTREGVVTNTKTGNRLGTKPNSKGYCQLGWKMPITKKVRHCLVHRLVFLLFGPGFTEERPYVNHKDGNKANNHIDNLEAASNQENVLHALETGLKPYFTEANKEAAKKTRGHNHCRCVLTREESIQIIKLHQTGLYSHRKLAKMFGVTKGAIEPLVNKKRYLDVWEEIDLAVRN